MGERGFQKSEFQDRTAKAQRLMQAVDIAALWFTTEPEIRYFSGFSTQFWQSPTRPWFLVLPANGPPVAVIPEIGVPLMRLGWISDIRSWPSPRPEDEGVGLLADCLAECAGEGDIGMPMGPESVLRMPLSDFDRLKSMLANRFVDASPILRQLRMTKSQAEIAKIRKACRIADRAFAALPSIVRDRMPLDLVFRKFRSACLSAGADDIAYLAGAAGPDGYPDVISPPTGSRLSVGDILMLDTGVVYDGYFCDFDRNFSIQEPSRAAQSAYRKLFDATEAALAAARPGATCSELYQSMKDVLGGGENNVGRLGHGLGMQLTEPPSLVDFDQTKLEPGMVLALEPAVSIDDARMMVQEENIVITDGGCELLSKRASAILPMI